ncbi:unnamed protein product [Chrysoparadoxa australica]
MLATPLITPAVSLDILAPLAPLEPKKKLEPLPPLSVGVAPVLNAPSTNEVVHTEGSEVADEIKNFEKRNSSYVDLGNMDKSELLKLVGGSTNVPGTMVLSPRSGQWRRAAHAKEITLSFAKQKLAGPTPVLEVVRRIEGRDHKIQLFHGAHGYCRPTFVSLDDTDPTEEHYLAVTAAKVRLHQLGPPPPTDAGDLLWQAWGMGITKRLRFKDFGEGGGKRLVIGPPLVNPATGLPRGFSLGSNTNSASSLLSLTSGSTVSQGLSPMKLAEYFRY